MNEALNGQWRKIRCNEFDVRRSGVEMSKPLGTRINNFLKKMPSHFTLGHLVDMGHVVWVVYPGVGQACQEHLMAAINFVAGEQVVKKKTTSRSKVPMVKREEKPAVKIVARGTEKPPERLDEVKEEAKIEVKEADPPKDSPFSGDISPWKIVEPSPSQSDVREDMVKKLAQKFNVSVHGKRLQESVATPASKQLEHNREMMTHGQLRRLCEGQSRRIQTLEVEKRFLVQELMDLKEAIAKLIGR